MKPNHDGKTPPNLDGSDISSIIEEELRLRSKIIQKREAVKLVPDWDFVHPVKKTALGIYILDRHSFPIGYGADGYANTHRNGVPPPNGTFLILMDTFNVFYIPLENCAASNKTKQRSSYKDYADPDIEKRFNDSFRKKKVHLKNKYILYTHGHHTSKDDWTVWNPNNPQLHGISFVEIINLIKNEGLRVDIVHACNPNQASLPFDDIVYTHKSPPNAGWYRQKEPPFDLTGYMRLHKELRDKLPNSIDSSL